MRYSIVTVGEKLVADYTGLNFLEIEELPIDTYFLLLRDAFIYDRQKTEAGREYLENCWRLEQTEPDRNALRQKFGKEGANGKKGLSERHYD